MNRTTILCALMAVSAVGSGPALAQRDQDERHGQQSHERDRDEGRGQQSHQRNQPPGQEQRGRQDHGRQGERGPHGPPPEAHPGNSWQDERGAGPDHRLHRGDRLPPDYHNRYYVVDDWRGHHLSAPPHGYHWVQVGGDYVLVAVATGIIMSLLLNQ